MVEGGEWRKLEKMDEGEIRKERAKETKEDGWRGIRIEWEWMKLVGVNEDEIKIEWLKVKLN